jgi:hypothetical protein
MVKMIPVRSIVLAFGVFGLGMHLLLTVSLVLIGYFDFFHLHDLARSSKQMVESAISLSKATPEPVLGAIGWAFHATDVEVNSVLTIAKWCARTGIVSWLAFAALFAYAFWPKHHAPQGESESGP